MTLKELRQIKQYSQAEVASILNVPLRTYKRYENDPEYEGSLKYNYFLKTLQNYKKSYENRSYLKKINVVVVGIGYVGLSTGILLSRYADVKFLDIDKKRTQLINNCISPFDNEIFDESLRKNKYFATTSKTVYKNADVVVVATPTNFVDEINSFDTTSVIETIEDINKYNPKCLIVIKSTIPIGFTEEISKKYNQQIIFSPEFLREKYALEDALSPSRIIIGADKVTDKVKMYAKYVEKCVKTHEKAHFMSSKEAESTKLFSNAYLALRLAFFNELDSFALENNLDTKEIIKGMGRDARIGDFYNNPSFAYGGYCLPKDTKELSTLLNKKNSVLIGSINESNNARLNFIKEEAIKKAIELTGKDKKDIVIGIYKLESKKVINKYRTSSSLDLMNLFKQDGIKTVVFDEIYEKSIKKFDDFVNLADVIVSNNDDKKLHSSKCKLICRSIK